MNNLTIIKVVVLYYIILSFTEWFLHRYLMHRVDGNFISDNIQKIHIMIYNYSACDKHEEHHKHVTMVLLEGRRYYWKEQGP